MKVKRAKTRKHSSIGFMSICYGKLFSILLLWVICWNGESACFQWNFPFRKEFYHLVAAAEDVIWPMVLNLCNKEPYIITDSSFILCF